MQERLFGGTSYAVCIQWLLLLLLLFYPEKVIEVCAAILSELENNHLTPHEFPCGVFVCKERRL